MSYLHQNPSQGPNAGSDNLPPNNPNYSPYETPGRRSQTIGRTPDEMQMRGGEQNIGQQQPHPQYSAPEQYSTGQTPGLSLQPSTPQASQYSTPTNLPGSLQPAGGAARPALPSNVNTAPPTVPTMHINTNAQQYSLPTRSNTLNSSQHSHSRSSPAGMDQQKYTPFSTNPDVPKYPHTPTQKFYSPTTPGASQSPLGLDQIRPRANSSMIDDGMSGTTMFSDTPDKVPTNSNYVAPWPTFAFDWCKWKIHDGSTAGKIAMGSYLEDPHNFITILETHIVPQDVTTPGAPPYGLEYSKVAEATCSYPVTRVLWEPPSSSKSSTDLIATSGDHLRLWSLPQIPQHNPSNTITRSSSVNTREQPVQKLTPLALLSNSKTAEHTAPLTSLDWNRISPKLIITSSIDTTCTIWDIPTLTAKTQLIAHDKEVFDVRFCAGSVDVFVSCGADGSVRMFDLRSLEHSTIIYEPADKGDKDKDSPGGGRMSPTKAQQTMSYSPPLLRLAANPFDSHLLATFAADSNLIRILDVRQPGQALLELRGHAAAVNAIEWSPSRRGMLASGGDDSQVLIWDLYHSQNGAALNGEANGGLVGGTAGQIGAKGPALNWGCEYEVGNLSWAPESNLTRQGGEWLGVSGGRGVWGIKL